MRRRKDEVEEERRRKDEIERERRRMQNEFGKEEK